MLLHLIVPRINDYMTCAIVETVHAEAGTNLSLGAKLFDLTVDLSVAAPHDCPPITHYRMAIREAAWLRRLAVRKGDQPAVGELLAVFSTEPDEPLDGPPARAVRSVLATIMYQSIWGSA